jgi:hypothetical protein
MFRNPLIALFTVCTLALAPSQARAQIEPFKVTGKGMVDFIPLCEPTAHRLHPNVVLPPPHRRAKVLRQPPVAARSSDG